jgi:hypothetical protein
MPYFYRKIRGKDLYKVFNRETGEVHAKETTLDKAKAQIRLLESKVPVQDLAGNFVNITYDIKELPKRGRGRPKKGGALGQVVDLVMNPIKEIKKEIQFYTNLVTGRKDYSPAVKKILGEYGDLVIEEATLYRKPLSTALTASINFVSLGEFYKNLNKTPYDKLFHLCIYLKTNKGIVSLEKEEVIVMKKGMFPRKDAELKPVTKLPQGLTINKALEQTKNRMGDKFFTYSASSNNCQDFILAFLQANNMGSDEDYTFVKQNTEQLFKNLPILRKIADAVTGAAARADVIRQGGNIVEELKKRERGQKNKVKEIGEEIVLGQLRQRTGITPVAPALPTLPVVQEAQTLPTPPPRPNRRRRSPQTEPPATRRRTLDFGGGSFFSRPAQPAQTTPPSTPREEPPPPPPRRSIGFRNREREERDDQTNDFMNSLRDAREQRLQEERRERGVLNLRQMNQRLNERLRQLEIAEARRMMREARQGKDPRRGAGVTISRPRREAPIQPVDATAYRTIMPNISYTDLRMYAELIRRTTTKTEIIQILDEMFDEEEVLAAFEELQLYTYLGVKLGIFIPPDLRDDDEEMYAIVRAEILRNRNILHQRVMELTMRVLSQPVIALATLPPMAEARIEGSGVYRKIRMGRGTLPTTPLGQNFQTQDDTSNAFKRGGIIVTPPGTPPPFNLINENTDLDVAYEFFSRLVGRWNGSNQSAAVIAEINDTYDAFVDFNPEEEHPNTPGTLLMGDLLDFVANLETGENFLMDPPEAYGIPANIVTRPSTPLELQGLGIKKKSPSTIKAMSKPNRWIEYVKSYAEKNGINYREALRDPNLKAGYKKGSGIATHTHPDGTVMTGATMTSKSKVIKKGTGMPSNQEAVIADNYNEKYLGANMAGM